MPIKTIFFEGFTSPKKAYKASDAIGYGITVPDALIKTMPRFGVKLYPVRPTVKGRFSNIEKERLAWLLEGQKSLLSLNLKKFDAIFIFHIFQQFPAEIKRILYDLKIDMPLVGYTHGSHWDPTDIFRFINYPNMETVDLANFLCLDKILVVSHYMQKVIVENIKKWQPQAAKKVNQKIAVVGLPINTGLINASYTEEKFSRPTIVFNHSLIPSKNPQIFLNLAKKILEKHDVNIIVTRDAKDPKTKKSLKELAQKHPKQVFVGGTYSLPEYFNILWKSDIQISTASHESFGVSTVEAMYTKNCCILPKRCSYPEITSNFDEILYKTPAELFGKVDYYLKNDKQRRSVAEKLHKISLNYSPENVSSKIAHVFKKEIKK